MSDKQINRVVVSIRTSCWSDEKGLYQTKSIKFLKRKSTGFNFIEEDISNIGPDLVINNIIDFNKAKDGKYQLIMCNYFTDHETGYVEDWDYKLIPHKDEKKIATKV